MALVKCPECQSPISDKARACVRCGCPMREGRDAGPPGLGAQSMLVHEPGGNLLRGLVNPDAWQITDRLFKVLPDGSWFDPSVSPNRPVQFELGAFVVPVDQQFWVMDYEFIVYRQSGIDPGDVVPAEAGRFSGVMGFDLNFTGRRQGDLLYQLDPVPVQVTRQTFDPPPNQRAIPAQFNISAAQSFAAASSQGTALLPVTTLRQGPRDQPFTFIGRQGDRVSLVCVIFKPVPTPVAAISGRVSGYLVHTNTGDALINRMRPR